VAVDTILLGGLRAPTRTSSGPLAFGASSPGTRAGDRWDGGRSSRRSGLDPFVAHLLDVGRDCYAPFVLGNAEALAAGRKVFSIQTYGEETSYLARPYPEQSRRMIHERIANRLSDGDRKRVVDFLEERGLGCFAP
jgi:hypothetical protein